MSKVQNEELMNELITKYEEKIRLIEDEKRVLQLGIEKYRIQESEDKHRNRLHERYLNLLEKLIK